MSLCKSYGKDKVIFATAEDHATPSKVELPESEPRPGLILENGDINWNCPCLGGMAIGPCGNEFREAFSCFHYRYVTHGIYRTIRAWRTVLHKPTMLSILPAKHSRRVRIATKRSAQ